MAVDLTLNRGLGFRGEIIGDGGRGGSGGRTRWVICKEEFEVVGAGMNRGGEEALS